MKKKSKPERGWCIENSDGLMLWTCRHLRQDAIECITDPEWYTWARPWKEQRRIGYRVVRVEVRKVEKAK